MLIKNVEIEQCKTFIRNFFNDEMYTHILPSAITFDKTTLEEKTINGLLEANDNYCLENDLATVHNYKNIEEFMKDTTHEETIIKETKKIIPTVVGAYAEGISGQYKLHIYNIVEKETIKL